MYDEEEINELLNASYEMAGTRKEMNDIILALNDTVFEHTIKIIFYPEDINQNKWRNEVCANYRRVNKEFVKGSTKKFKEEVYTPLFDSNAKSFMQWRLRVINTLEGLEKRGFNYLKLDDTQYLETFDIYKRLRSYVLKVFTDKTKVSWTNEDFRALVDKVLDQEHLQEIINDAF